MPEIRINLDTILSYKQAAEILHITRPAIYWMVSKGKLRSIEIGGKRFIMREDVEKLKKERAA